VEDLAGYVEGTALDIALREVTADGDRFAPRPFQRSAVEGFWAAGSTRGGTGVVVLPCGAGKTIVGMGVMEQARAHTLILVTSIVAARQWKRELLDKTTVSPEQIGEYSGERKDIRPVTIATTRS
jgi:DNA excision repair protein ERCC-3